MIDLPQLNVDEIQRAADWVEACVLFSPEGVLSQTDVSDQVLDSGLLGFFAEEVFEEDAADWDEDAFGAKNSADGFAEQVWQVLADRSRTIAGGFPFKISAALVERESGSSWRDYPAYSLLLISDIGRYYTEVSVRATADAARLFEKVVEASERGLLRGCSCRFGWPREPGWPKPVDERIGELGRILGLDVENLEGKTTVKDKDRGLDVVGRLSFGDDGEGSLVLLTQCALGKHWRKKRGEPALPEWRDVFKWHAQLVRAVAVPWRLEPPHDYRYTSRRFDAVVLDRMRLSAGRPDEFIAADVRSQIIEWCEQRVQQFPAST